MPAGFPQADCGSLGAWLTSLSSVFPPLNGLKVTGNQKEMKRVAPLKQMRLKEVREKKKDIPRELWDNIKHTNIDIIGIPEGKERKDLRRYLKQ